MSAVAGDFGVNKYIELIYAFAQITTANCPGRKVVRLFGPMANYPTPILLFVCIRCVGEHRPVRGTCPANHAEPILNDFQATQYYLKIFIKFFRYKGVNSVFTYLIHNFGNIFMVSCVVFVHDLPRRVLKERGKHFSRFGRKAVPVPGGFRAAEVVKYNIDCIRPVLALFLECEEPGFCLTLLCLHLHLNLPNKWRECENTYHYCSNGRGPSTEGRYPFPKIAVLACENGASNGPGNRRDNCGSSKGQPVVQVCAFHPAFLTQPRGLREAA